ncbi:MAG: BON domain-containing protein [Alphaproteobacteria bacterium]|nr:BON domain-containing protein [Alphaproteobacteria bacterium]MBU1512656.1 BON domain-containing protein [Alphaproteobacteria bacterium]MBU2095050.1 BON domain-containing protein [Alphaproteobacteria bacterium]MBU2151831.1 BON domain-containing protein [Alphaproteobacteria bacterium]MBU2306230.1 BON domain-containing protein [Alphaproteobacteria bacterium]
MQRGDYEAGYRPNPWFSGQDYTRGEGRRFGSAEADQRWAREMRRPASGGTGGYDYERGYGDGGRGQGDHGDFEDRARDAGEFFRRTGQRISNWFSDVAGEGSYDRNYGDDRPRYDEFRGARGRGPKGYQRSDERINDEVHQRLTDDHWLDATEISVAVSNGDVTLSGTVENREAKHRAERIVEDLSGVKHVQNNLRLQTSGYSASAAEPRVRTEGDAANLTSATAKGTTTRGN